MGALPKEMQQHEDVQHREPEGPKDAMILLMERVALDRKIVQFGGSAEIFPSTEEVLARFHQHRVEANRRTMSQGGGRPHILTGG